MNKQKLLLIPFLLIIAAFAVSAGSYYEFWTAIEDNSQASAGDAYYIGGDIRVFAQDITTGTYVFEETKTSTVSPTEHNDFYAAYQYYYPIPTNTIMTVDVDVPGYLTDGQNAIDQLYISSGLTQAFITLRAQDQAGQTPDVWKENNNGFTTVCQFIRVPNTNGDQIPFLECSMEKNTMPEASGMFLFTQFLIAGNLEDIVITTTKVYPEATTIDADGDGFGVNDDCDDDPSDDPTDITCPATKWDCTESTSACAICRHPGALEVCDGFDNNCNTIDDNTEGVCGADNCADNDGDGFKVPITSGAECGLLDCDDRVINDIPVGFLRNPNAYDGCNGFDDNCDCWSLNAGLGDDTNNDGIVCGPGDLNVDNGYGASNECTSRNFYCDADGDGEAGAALSGTCDWYGCVPTGCFLTPGQDCDDNDPNRFTTNPEVCDGIDNDCNSATVDGVDEIPLLNPLQDGVCAGTNQICLGGMWNPDYSGITAYEPAEMTCDTLDNDCDGSVDEGGICSGLVDLDNDGYFNDVDCDDTNPAVNPGATEICNSIDDNCDGSIDENNICGPILVDLDNDGYYNDVDCNDNNAAINPGATEVCNNVDDNCDGFIDENNVCGATVISTTFNPTHPLDSQDIVCTIAVNNVFDSIQNDVTVSYEITGGVSAIGSFTCPNGNCVQDLTILGTDTPADTYVYCKAWFNYASSTYEDETSAYVYSETVPNDDDNKPVPKATVSRSRFIGTDTINPGDELEFELQMENKGYDLRNLKAQIMLMGVTNMEYQRFSIGPFNLDSGDQKTSKLYIPIPQNTKRGMYYARISIGDGDYRYVKHRVFFVK